MTDKKKDNGEPTPSRIVIEFTGPGISDFDIRPEGGVSPGQFDAATLRMVGISIFRTFGGMQMQVQQQAEAERKKMQEEAMMRNAVKKVMETKQ